MLFNSVLINLAPGFFPATKPSVSPANANTSPITFCTSIKFIFLPFLASALIVFTFTYRATAEDIRAAASVLGLDVPIILAYEFNVDIVLDVKESI